VKGLIPFKILYLPLRQTFRKQVQLQMAFSAFIFLPAVAFLGGEKKKKSLSSRLEFYMLLKK